MKTKSLPPFMSKFGPLVDDQILHESLELRFEEERELVRYEEEQRRHTPHSPRYDTFLNPPQYNMNEESPGKNVKF